MAQNDAQARVLEEWFRLPESRRSHPTDAVAFAFRLLREEPELFRGANETSHEMITKWLLPHIHKAQLKSAPDLAPALTVRRERPRRSLRSALRATLRRPVTPG